MKILFTVLMLFLMFNCVSQKNAQTTSQATTMNKNTSLAISYKAITRGSSKVLEVKNSVIVYKTNQKNKEIILSSEEKEELKKIVDAIALEKMQTFKAPSKKRMHDGALHANLVVKKDSKEYASTTFDDGHPPTELEPLLTFLMEKVK